MPAASSSEWDEIRARGEEVLSKTAAASASEVEALLRSFAEEIRAKYPRAAEDIQRWKRDGFFLIAAFEHALKSALTRRGSVANLACGGIPGIWTPVG
jgi:hypothetical protein